MSAVAGAVCLRECEDGAREVASRLRDSHSARVGALPFLSMMKRDGARVTNSAVLSLQTFEAVTERIRAGADHWQLLGVERDASSKQIQIAHRQLCVLLHPDRASFRGKCERVEVEKAFQAVSNAFNVLNNPAKLAEYKQALLRQQLGGGAPQRAGGVDMRRALVEIEDHIKRRDWAKAEAAVHDLRKRAPGQQSSKIELLLGWSVYNNPAHPQSQRYTAATTVWQRVARREGAGSMFAQAAYYMAHANRQAGELDKAEDWAAQCLRAAPDHIEGQRLQRLLVKAQQKEASAPQYDEDSGVFERAVQKSGSYIRKLLDARK